ncbi:flagellar biosynthetic protein FlhB [Parvularcula bermudensis HTCC2503]|uniref:Flagellar biosynthetic protein FlhB n=1 Tax=Parvularcula bermudensis (strain ATCC BAA-594 / HTCC2503 / KCTC 12087) TaxID=314260 RepID=E0TH67_PARBH|nr:EscU/YscU/HrcU family type III secretion system export apparatus switch protein [Parvularcula bermudensis]ADM09651.1 flagellar biosynthetic protein FlhB [Parvularcula bermudensis HTCC2503]
MAENQDEAEKSHEATPERIKQARQKGDVAQSPEVLVFARYLGILVALLGFVSALAMNMATSLNVFMARPFEASARLMSDADPLEGFGSSALFFFALMAAPIALVIAGLIAQQALVFAPNKIKPDLNKLNPVKNAKQKFGKAALTDFVRNTVKITIVMVVGMVIGLAQTGRLTASVGAPPGLLAEELAGLARIMVITGVILAAIAAGIDLPIKWSQYRERLKMSRQELKDETKSTEGDPAQRSERQKRAREIAQNRQLLDVPDADVVVVNPEHYAVALQWNRHRGEVPRCIAKGVDAIALRIRNIADEAGVPLYRDVQTARSLYAVVEVGEEIRYEHYEAVAAAIRFADKLRAKRH